MAGFDEHFSPVVVITTEGFEHDPGTQEPVELETYQTH
jgi:hypothetical protein